MVYPSTNPAAVGPQERAIDQLVTEADFQAKVMDYARLRGWMVAHFRPAQTRSGRWATQMQGDKGFPDLVLARRGRVIFAELKAERGRASQEQLRWLEAVESDPMRRYVWKPSDWPAIERLLV